MDKCVVRLHWTARKKTRKLQDESRQKEKKTKAKLYKA